MSFQNLKNHDWLITLVIIVLTTIGILTIASTTVNSNTEASGAGSLQKQLIFIIFGFVVYFFLSILDLSWIKTKAVVYGIYFVTIFLLILVLFVGQEIAGTNRWLDIGFFSLQPSEYAKITLIIFTAFIFKKSSDINLEKDYKFSKSFDKKANLGFLKNIFDKNSFTFKIFFSAITSFPIVFLTLIQPSLGNAVIISFIWILLIITLIPKPKDFILFTLIFSLILFSILQFFTPEIQNDAVSISINQSPNYFFIIVGFALLGILSIVSRIKAKSIVSILIIISLFFISFTFVWNNFITDYQKQRIETFIAGPESDSLGSGYQVRQSIVAIGSGRLLGRGYLEGTQSSLHVLTQAHTDFIFASISEQFGFLGSSLVLFLYIVLITRILKVATSSKDEFGTIISIGVAFLILLHVFINISMNMGTIPVTGIPLPLISYGGSSILLIMISLGIVQSVSGSKKAVDISDTLMLRSLS